MASGAEPLTEALAQALARDGPRSSRHAPESEAPGYPIENMGRYPHAMGRYPHVIDGDSSTGAGGWLHLYKPSLTTRIQIWVHQTQSDNSDSDMGARETVVCEGKSVSIADTPSGTLG